MANVSVPNITDESKQSASIASSLTNGTEVDNSIESLFEYRWPQQAGQEESLSAIIGGANSSLLGTAIEIPTNRLADNEQSQISSSFHQPSQADMDDSNLSSSTGANQNILLSKPDWYMVQEVLTEFLNIKSFKRKYPDIPRRPVDGYERDFLVRQGLVTSSQAVLGLTALRSEEVLDLLARDYKHYFEPVQTMLHSRRLQHIQQRQKIQYESSRVERGSRIKHARKRAMKSTTDFNRHLVHDRLKERRYYWDLQTLQIHVTRPAMVSDEDCLKIDGDHEFGCPPQSEPTIKKHRLEVDPDANYPVALLPGQYAQYYKRYTPNELYAMPLRTCLSNLPRPESDLVQLIVQDQPADSSLPKSPPDYNSNPLSPSHVLASDEDSQGFSTVSSQRTATTLLQDPKQACSVCAEVGGDMVHCIDCKRQGHPSCLDLPPHVVLVIKTYDWSCMECKKCTECEGPEDEEAMLFCDRCDRGYHYYCVGLASIPEGQWQCSLCSNTT